MAVAAFWQAMTQRYGRRWGVNYGDTPPDAGPWNELVSTLTDGEITRGLSDCSSRFPEWPPTVGEFLKLCRPSSQPVSDPSQHPWRKPPRQTVKARDRSRAAHDFYLPRIRAALTH